MRRFYFLAIVSALLTGCGAQAAEKNPVVVMETSQGTIKIELFADKAPVTVKNFLSYVDAKFYDSTIFHRVPRDRSNEVFVIQGGGVEPDLTEKKTKEPIKNESSNGLSNERYTIAMARTDDPNSATSQFFINVKDNKFLDKQDERNVGYCVFGKVIEGMDVVDKIKVVKTENKGRYKEIPVENVIIKSVRRAEK